MPDPFPASAAKSPVTPFDPAAPFRQLRRMSSRFRKDHLQALAAASAACAPASTQLVRFDSSTCLNLLRPEVESEWCLEEITGCDSTFTPAICVLPSKSCLPRQNEILHARTFNKSFRDLSRSCSPPALRLPQTASQAQVRS